MDRMANRHFGNFADVWKHLVLCEVLSYDRPASYAETHAGSAANLIIDDTERRFGVLRFLEVAGAHEVLTRSSRAAGTARCSTRMATPARTTRVPHSWP